MSSLRKIFIMFFDIMITHYMKKSIVEENLEGDSIKNK